MKHKPAPNVCLVWAHKNPMKAYPEFRKIWKERRDKVLEDYDDHFRTAASPYEEKECSIFIILHEGKPVGVTGYCYYAETRRVGLVWHGVVEEARGKGIAAEALRRVMKMASYRFPNLNTFVKLIPIDREPILAPFFKRMGFINTGNEYKVDWLPATTKWFEWAKNL